MAPLLPSQAMCCLEGRVVGRGCAQRWRQTGPSFLASRARPPSPLYGSEWPRPQVHTHLGPKRTPGDSDSHTSSGMDTVSKSHTSAAGLSGLWEEGLTWGPQGQSPRLRALLVGALARPCLMDVCLSISASSAAVSRAWRRASVVLVSQGKGGLQPSWRDGPPPSANPWAWLSTAQGKEPRATARLRRRDWPAKWEPQTPCALWPLFLPL